MKPIKDFKNRGSGNGSLITLGKIDSFIQTTHSWDFWDLCAPEAVIRAMGGIVKNIKGKKILYDEL